MDRDTDDAFDETDVPDYVDALDDLLSAIDSPLLATSFSALCAAIVVCPQLLTPADWLPVVLGEADEKNGEALAVLEDEAAMSAAVALLMEAYNDTADGLTDGSWQPLFDVDRDGSLLWQIWMEGFADAFHLAPDAWLGLLDHPDAAVASAAIVLLRLIELGDKSAVEIAADPDDAAMVAQAPALIAGAIRELHDARLAGFAGRQPVRRVKVGRNDPCPCGSGRKYKKCCGA